jgi:hypothetical protein
MPPIVDNMVEEGLGSHYAIVQSVVLRGGQAQRRPTKWSLSLGRRDIPRDVHSQLSAFHMMDGRLRDSSCASMSGAIILFFYHVATTKPLLNVIMSGVHVTRIIILGALIKHIWVKRTRHSLSAKGREL